MLERAAQLIDNAGGGNWNREEADWQLRAAEWKKDLANLSAQPDPFVLEDDLTPREAVQRSVGAASMCWANPGGAGEFDTDRASYIARTLVSWLRRHPADDSRDLVARAWHLLRQVPENMVLPPWEQQAHQLGADIRAHGWFPQRDDPDQQPLALEDTGPPTQQWPAEYVVDGGPVSADRLVAFTSGEQDTVVDAEVVDPDLVDSGPRRPMLPAAYPRQEPSGGYPTAPGSPDLGDDPDGDLDGYDGPAPGQEGGYCSFNGATPHPRGTRPGCDGCGHQYQPPAKADHGFPAEQLFVDRGGS